MEARAGSNVASPEAMNASVALRSLSRSFGMASAQEIPFAYVFGKLYRHAALEMPAIHARLIAQA